jgi:hypothetical protein
MKDGKIALLLLQDDLGFTPNELYHIRLWATQAGLVLTMESDEADLVLADNFDSLTIFADAYGPREGVSYLYLRPRDMGQEPYSHWPMFKELERLFPVVARVGAAAFRGKSES